MPVQALSPAPPGLDHCTASREPAASAPSPRPCAAPACRGSPSVAPPVNVVVSCAATQLAPPAPVASAASSPASAAAPPAWAASSAEAADWRRKTVLQMAGGAALLLLAFALLMTFLAMYRSDERGGFRITTHWGGFGSNAGGWRLSPPLVSLALAVALALAAAMVLGTVLKVVSVDAPAHAGDKK